MYSEPKFYTDTCIINENGIPFDREYLEALYSLGKETQLKYAKQFSDLGVNPKSNLQIKEFIASFGEHHLEPFKTGQGKYSFAKDKMKDFPIRKGTPEKLMNFLILKRNYSSYSLDVEASKILYRLPEDGRLKDSLMHFGTKTGRINSYSVNMIKMPRGNRNDDILKPDYFRNKYALEERLQALTSAFRGSIKAPEGSTFLIADLKNIDPLRLAYDTGNTGVLMDLLLGESLYQNYMYLLGVIEKHFVKMGCMAYLYEANLWKKVRFLFIQACEAESTAVEEERLNSALNLLRDCWVKYLSPHKYSLDKIWYQKRSSKLSAVCFNKNEKDGSCYVLKNNLTGTRAEIKGIFIGPPEKQFFSKVSTTNQQRAGWVHKIVRHEAIKRGLKIVLDVHDELVIESKIKDVKENKKLYDDAIYVVRNFYGGIEKFPLHYEIKESRYYGK